MLPFPQYHVRPQDPGGGFNGFSRGGHHQSSSCGGGGGSRDRSLDNVSLSLVRSTVVPSDEDLRQIRWGKAYDTNTGRYYYFTLDSSKIVWENPLNNIQDIYVHHHHDQQDVSGEAVPSDEELRRIGWGKAYDTNTGYHYYFKLDRSKRVWKNPLTLSSVQDVDVRAHHYDGEVVPSDEDLRQIGWEKAYDTFSGCYFYFTLDPLHRSKTVWENPLNSIQDIYARAHHDDDQRDVSGEGRTKRRRKRRRKRKTSSRVESHDDETRASGGEKLVELGLDEFGRCSRGRSRDRSVDVDARRDRHYGRGDMSSESRNIGHYHSSRSNGDAPQRSQSCGPHSRYPSSSRDDHYYHQERSYSSPQHRKRSRSPDPQTTVIQNAMEDLTNLATGIERRSHDANNQRRPLVSINGAACHPMTSNGPQRHDATLSFGQNGVNNMSSHRNHHQQPQYHHYHHLMDASQQRRPLASYLGMQAPKINKMNNIPELIQAAHSCLSAMRPPNTAAFCYFLAKHMNENNQLNLRYEQMGSHINELFQHARRTLEMFGMKDLTQTTYSMAKLVASLRKLGSSSFYRKDHIASLLSNLLLHDDGRIRENLFLSLANASVRIMDQFDARHISNLAYAYALIRFVPVLIGGKDLFYQVAKTAIQRKEDFNSQDVANLLWSYATMGIVDEQLFLFSSFAPIAAKLIDSYNNQELANTAWAYAVANIDSPVLFNDRFIDKCLGKRNGFSLKTLSQLHQWHLWQTKEKSNVGLPEELQDRCYKAFISEEPTPSKLQNDVVSQLSSIGLDPKQEALMDSGYRIDALVEVKGKTICVEVDGPFHFIGRSESPTGSTIMKRRQVPSIDGIDLVSVPYWEWNKLGKDQGKQQEYLRMLLNL